MFLCWENVWVLAATRSDDTHQTTLIFYINQQLAREIMDLKLKRAG